MTKLKNTKKGMAKKALSISLVAAMLATSNVPVWAAEFTDGTDAVVEAPVVEAPVEEVTDTETFAAGDVITENDIDVSGITFKVGDTDVKGKEVTFGQTVTVAGSIIKKTDNTALQGFEYGWRVQGDTASIKTGEVSNGSLNESLSQTNYANFVGKTLEFYVFRDDDAAKINPTVVGTVKIVDAEVKDAKLTLDDTALTNGFVYNGHDYVYGETSKYADDSQNVNTVAIKEMDFGTAGKWDKDFVLENFTITTTQSAKNAGDKLIITATPKADSPYKNSVSAEVEISKKTYGAGDLIVELTESVSYPYTGNTITVPNDKVIMKEGEHLSNAVLPANVIEKAEIPAVNATVGTGKKVVVTSEPKNLVNYDVSKGTIETSGIHTATIEKRDLSSASTKISVQNGKIPVGVHAGDLQNRLDFKGTETGTPDLTLVKGSDYVLEVKKSDGTVVGNNEAMQSGTYTATFTAPSNSVNTFGSQTLTFVVGDKVVKDVKFANKATYKPAYTGSEVKPTKDDLGNLTIVETVVGGTEKETTIQKAHYEIVSYDKNTDAATYDKDGNVLTQSDVVVKILPGAGSFENETFTVHFEIQPLTVSSETVTVPKAISYNSNYTKAEEYKVPLVVTAKDSTGKIVKGLSASDYTVEYEFEDGTNKPNDNGVAQNEIHDKIKATLTITNPNFKGEKGKDASVKLTDTTEIVAKALTDSMIKINPSSYTYTGGNIIPEFVVLDGAIVLYDQAEFGDKGEYKVTGITGLNVGTGKVTIEGVNDFYSGTASATFQITPANTSSVKVEIGDQDYTGKQVRPREFKASLNGNDVSKQFKIVSYGENVKAGKGTVVLKLVDGNKNFTGADITAEFNIVKEKVAGTLAVYDENGKDVTSDYVVDDKAPTTSYAGKAFDFDGTAKTFGTEKLTLTTPGTKAKVSDFEIKYADNISGKKSTFKDNNGNTYNVAYVYAVAKEGTGYAGEGSFTLADGSKVTGVVAIAPFLIKNVHFNAQNVTVKNGSYAGGLPVKPQVLVQIKGNTLVEGKDYELKLTGATTDNHYTDATVKNIFKVEVVGKGGYEGSGAADIAWGIEKKDLSDCDVKAVNGVVTVMNGYVPVPTTEYTVKENDDKTYTVTANKDSKNYTGTKTVAAEGLKPEEGPEAPVITDVKVVGNKATVVLSGECEGATGYDYVISTENDYKNGRLPNGINKNQLVTKTSYQYLDQGIYYAYCHAWKKVNGKKVFSGWSNIYPFAVTSITPSKPVVTSVKVSKNTVKVTYTKSANATGYDLVLGKSMKKVNGEMRPVEYGKLVKKVYNGNTVTATFTKVPKGTYYVGLHAYNRTSEDGKKVFSPWSNAKKVVVK